MMGTLSRLISVIFLGGSLAATLAGCSGGGSASPFAPPVQSGGVVSANSASSSALQMSSVAISIAVPSAQELRAQSVGRSLEYVSASTKSASIEVNNGGQAQKSSVDCGTSCNASLQVPVGVNTFSVALYDGSNATGHVLATGNATATIAKGKANTVALVFSGVPAGLTINVNPGTVTSGTAATAKITVTVADAAGHLIVGAQNYAKPIVLTHSDTSGAAVLSTTTILSPTYSASVRYGGSAAFKQDVITASSGVLSANAVLTAVPAPTPVPATPAPTATPLLLNPASTGVPSTIARTHILTYQELLGSTQTTPFGKNYGEIARYIDIGTSDANATPALRAAGMKVGFYSTVHTVCITQVFGQCTPDAGETPDSVMAKTCDGHRVTFSSPSSSLVQFQTDPSKADLATLLNKVIDDRVANYGYGNVQYDFVFDDNANVPGDSLSYQHWYDFLTGGITAPGPYCGYSNANYIAGMRSLYSKSKLPVVSNGLNIPDAAPAASSAVQYFNGTPNAMAGMFEFIYGSNVNGPDRVKESGRFWQSEENTQLAVSNSHRLFVGYEHVGGTDRSGLDARLYVYASLMLGYDPDTIVLADNGTESNSHVGANPESQIVPMYPLVPQPTDISALQKAGGAYAREFAACYYLGKYVGPCASVVNSNASSAVPFPGLSRSYAHTAVISGSGVVPGRDTGTVVFNGPAASSNIPAKTAVIVFP